MNRIERGGVTESKVAFALGSKDGAGDRRDMGFLQQYLRCLAALLMDRLHPREGVERAGGRFTLQAKIVEPCNEQIAALAVLAPPLDEGFFG